jgi:HemY protein
MVRILVFLFAIGLLGLGIGYLLEQPGSLALTWFGYHIETSPLVGLSLVAITAIVVWGLLRFFLNMPSLVALTTRARKRERGHEALTRGILAAGAGDAQKAQRASRDAKKLLPNEPLTLLLDAQAAQLSGDRLRAERAFRSMAERPDTRLLGLRGLHAENLRRGDHDQAHGVALQAQQLKPLAWSGQAVLDRHTEQNDWEAARLCVAQNLRAKIVDAATANRQKAVLDTALAIDCEVTDTDRAIKLLRAAVKKAPDLVPANALLARLLIRRGNVRAASKVIEAAYAKTPHPDLAQAYTDMRPGESSADRLQRAKSLARIAPGDPESAMMIATAALGARAFDTARQAMAPLIAEGERPTARMCLIMAEIEDVEHDAQGLVREWLSRGSRAPRDAAWVADGFWSKHWAPVSPVTGKLDAFRWERPKDELSGPIEAPPPAYEPPPPPSSFPAFEDESEPQSAEQAAQSVPASAEALPPEEKAEAPRSSNSPQPVVFPLPSPPDDPGPKRETLASRPF